MAGRPPIGGGRVGPGMLGDDLRDRLDASAARHGEARFAALRRLLRAALDHEDTNGAANAREVQARINRAHERAALARDYGVLAVERCRDCGKVPGNWQPTVGGRRDELTLEECRTCGAAWTGRIGSRG